VIKLSKSLRNLWGILIITLVIDVLLWWHPFMTDNEHKSVIEHSRLGIPLSMEFTQPIPTNLHFDPQRVALGRMLFDEKRLSADDSIACSNCHVLRAGGVDNLVSSTGINGAQGGINAPTVLNSGYNFVQFWDGRAATLEDQIDGPLMHPKEMGTNWSQVLEKLNRSAQYLNAFSVIYPDQITVANIKDAIATFERSLVTPNSRFDQYLRGDTAALSARELNGYKLFQSYGCVSCHQGINLGGNMYERMGMMADYFGDRGKQTEEDNGRFNVTKKEVDRHYFRVPTLRNIAKTAPYFHDGSVQNLHDAVQFMGRYQLGRTIPKSDTRDIVEFLNTLTGELEWKVL
jgi:cytochrome c peroxidase